MKESENKLLKFYVNLQHKITGDSTPNLTDIKPKDFDAFNEKYIEPIKDTDYYDEQFINKLKDNWNETYDAMYNKGDFAHQQITTAAILAPGFHKDGGFSNNYGIANVESRTAKFLEKHSLSEVVDKIYEEHYHVPKKDPIVLTMDEKVNEIKKKAPDAYNFIMSLENALQKMENYAGTEGN